MFVIIIGGGKVGSHLATLLLEEGHTVRVIDMRDHIVLPGLVNTHHHLYQTLTRCIAQDSGLFNWLKTLYPIWLGLTSEAIHVSAQTGLAELMLSGCTTASDHLYIYPNDCSIDDEIRAAQEVGIRGIRLLRAANSSYRPLPLAGALGEEVIINSQF